LRYWRVRYIRLIREELASLPLETADDLLNALHEPLSEKLRIGCWFQPAVEAIMGLWRRHILSIVYDKYFAQRRIRD